jgi:hypothetical protein
MAIISASTPIFMELTRKSYELFPHLMRRVKEVVLQDDIRRMGQILYLRYSNSCSEQIHIEHMALLEVNQPIMVVLEELRKRENYRRPKHATELHSRIAKSDTIHP